MRTRHSKQLQPATVASQIDAALVSIERAAELLKDYQATRRPTVHLEKLKVARTQLLVVRQALCQP